VDNILVYVGISCDMSDQVPVPTVTLWTASNRYDVLAGGGLG